MRPPLPLTLRTFGALAIVLLSSAARAQEPPKPPEPAKPDAPAEPPATAPTSPAPTSPAPTAPAPAAPAPAAPAPAAPAPTAPVAPTGQPQLPPAGMSFASLGKKYTSWDGNIEGGVGRVLTAPGETVGLLRVRAGVLVIRDPHFYAIGLTYELSHISAATLGVQAEYLSLETGIFAQLGPLVDVAEGGRLGFMGAFGFSVLGAEYQGRDYGEFGFAHAVFGKVRIPLGIIGFGIRGR